ncbi:2-C-methyl-D-erythritol 2,4-cyclodiphosphate synthase [Hartmannibacter diazotrophicus]|uniref:Bifunctional enzyme IspD/IspF n=1 Tax=Hartmannibacter diazotrophicus TaxID=1482074 RepID=A0A2C9D7Y7_9HYPH|nr:bifunctional 2-C-methyl-D-erythritol 4-phosphate cytidylyltransferase/2-C-methyl-D-erythritol 2,4-cyclodiphosphate synthase [Hartmannibacter diazotrophicus]SON55861.1 2-C-methyl-D-erythritol 2,4-cyclodiphosphate synthase [Hartmannibacter diazotrophicus]
MTDARHGKGPSVAVLVVAAGRGRRMGDSDKTPKQYRQLGQMPVLSHTLKAFLMHADVGSVTAVIHPDDLNLYEEAVAGLPASLVGRLRPPVFGADERQASVLAGLRALKDESPGIVLIHDGVRPFVPAETVDAVLTALESSDAVCAGVPVVDTIKRCGADDVALETVPRDGLWRAATPQGFQFEVILTAHEAAANAVRTDFTDDTAVHEWNGGQTRMVPCPGENIKLTRPDDFERAERRLTEDTYLRLADVRVGNGYDVHALEPGDGVTLGGVFIAHTQRLKGHSDADVVLHALTDAVLGALGDGDIGSHFPPSDERWLGAPSSIFLADAVARVAARGGMVAHLDASIIAEAPKVGPHREAMRAAIAAIAGISLDRVGVKATTNEGLGFAGRREGIAAIATATIRLPIDAEPL